MNALIQELALQAKFYSFADGELQSPFRDEEDISDLLEKFAELIVAECVHAVRDRGGMCGALASNWIEEHFGVKS